jgi:hypothetical protein
MKLNKLAHYGDLLAIPFFILILIYFSQKEHKTLVEKLIMLFIALTLVADLLFSFIFLTSK